MQNKLHAEQNIRGKTTLVVILELKLLPSLLIDTPLAFLLVMPHLLPVSVDNSSLDESMTLFLAPPPARFFLTPHSRHLCWGAALIHGVVGVVLWLFPLIAPWTFP